MHLLLTGTTFRILEIWRADAASVFIGGRFILLQAVGRDRMGMERKGWDGIEIHKMTFNILGATEAWTGLRLR